MALVKTNYPLFGNLFDDFFGTELADWRNQNFSATNTTLPKVNIKEDENGFIVEMAAPGMKKGDFKINVDNSAGDAELTFSKSRMPVACKRHPITTRGRGPTRLK